MKFFNLPSSGSKQTKMSVIIINTKKSTKSTIQTEIERASDSLATIMALQKLDLFDWFELTDFEIDRLHWLTFMFRIKFPILYRTCRRRRFINIHTRAAALHSTGGDFHSSPWRVGLVPGSHFQGQLSLLQGLRLILTLTLAVVKGGNCGPESSDS